MFKNEWKRTCKFLVSVIWWIDVQCRFTTHINFFNTRRFRTYAPLKFEVWGVVFEFFWKYQFSHVIPTYTCTTNSLKFRPYGTPPNTYKISRKSLGDFSYKKQKLESIKNKTNNAKLCSWYGNLKTIKHDILLKCVVKVISTYKFKVFIL